VTGVRCTKKDRKISSDICSLVSIRIYVFGLERLNRIVRVLWKEEEGVGKGRKKMKKERERERKKEKSENRRKKKEKIISLDPHCDRWIHLMTKHTHIKY
jgi:hypothetical protein